MTMAEDMELRVRSKSIAHEQSDIAKVVTVSLGVAGRGAKGSGDVMALLAQADAQLYNAKHAGRGRVCGDLIKPA